MRKAVIAGNWKLNNDNDSTREFLNPIKAKIDTDKVDVIICPTFTSISTAIDLCKDTNIKIGAQNMHWEISGAYTGEVSAEMLKELGIEFVIIGHSERRQYFNETDETVNKKAVKALSVGLKPIICVGESLEERENGIQKNIVTEQVRLALKGISEEDIKNTIIAYEPIWAIGTGKTATNQQAEEVCAWIRDTVRELYSEKAAEEVRIQYW